MLASRLILICFVAVAGTACTSATSRVFPACHFSVEIPNDWTITESKTECKFYVDPRDWDQRREASETVPPDHAMIIDIHHASLEEAMEIAGLEREDDGSWVHGGRAPTTAEPCSTKHERGQCVTALYGVFLKDQPGYQGLGDYEIMVLSNGEYSVIITDQAGDSRVVDSFRFQ